MEFYGGELTECRVKERKRTAENKLEGTALKAGAPLAGRAGLNYWNMPMPSLIIHEILSLRIWPLPPIGIVVTSVDDAVSMFFSANFRTCGVQICLLSSIDPRRREESMSISYRT